MLTVSHHIEQLYRIMIVVTVGPLLDCTITVTISDAVFGYDVARGGGGYRKYGRSHTRPCLLDVNTASVCAPNCRAMFAYKGTVDTHLFNLRKESIEAAIEPTSIYKS